MLLEAARTLRHHGDPLFVVHTFDLIVHEQFQMETVVRHKQLLVDIQDKGLVIGNRVDISIRWQSSEHFFHRFASAFGGLWSLLRAILLE